MGVKLHEHVFGYSEGHRIINPNELQNIITEGKPDIIQLFHSDKTMLNYLHGYKGKIVVHHTGTLYREKYKEVNRIFNPVVWKSGIALGEFKGLGAKDERFITMAVDTKKMMPRWRYLNKPYKFLHCPSNPLVKGTAAIKRMMSMVKGVNFSIDTKIVNHEQSWQRMYDCDIYIELFQPTLKGYPYGSFGTTAIEAAALGKIVVTQHLHPEAYQEVYGKTPLIIAKDEKEFIQKIKWLNSLEPIEIFKLQHAHRDWAVSKHSFLATGEKLKRILEIEN